MGTGPPLPAGYRMSEISVVDDDALTALLGLVNTIGSERVPRSAPHSPAELRTYLSGPGIVRRHLLVSKARGPTAYMTTRYREGGSNPTLLEVAIGVDPAHRRRGIASALLGAAVEEARELGRTSLTGDVYDTVPAAGAFASVVGTKVTNQMHVNIMAIDRLDRGLLESWAEGGERRPDYTLTIVDGMYPEELIEGLVPLYVAVDRDSPRPEGEEPMPWTPELLRDWMSNFVREVDIVTAIAMDGAGTPVGMSQVTRRRSDETTWSVTFTMVDADHRRRGLGKWVKAASCLHALERWPGGARMETGNAFANDPMLAINHAMGFRHEYTVTEVSVSVDRVADFVASRSGRGPYETSKLSLLRRGT